MPPVLKQSNAGTYVSRFTSDKQKMWEQAMQSVMANYKLDQATYKELMAAYRLATKEQKHQHQEHSERVQRVILMRIWFPQQVRLLLPSNSSEMIQMISVILFN